MQPFDDDFARVIGEAMSWTRSEIQDDDDTHDDRESLVLMTGRSGFFIFLYPVDTEHPWDATRLVAMPKELPEGLDDPYDGMYYLGQRPSRGDALTTAATFLEKEGRIGLMPTIGALRRIGRGRL